MNCLNCDGFFVCFGGSVYVVVVKMFGVCVVRCGVFVDGFGE